MKNKHLWQLEAMLCFLLSNTAKTEVGNWGFFALGVVLFIASWTPFGKEVLVEAGE